MDKPQRSLILAELVRYTGRHVSWRFIKHTAEFIPTIARFHNLVTGIYKPAWSEYALSIRISLGSPYEHKDEILYLEDGRWLMTYAPRTGGLKHGENRALLSCLEDRVPLAIFQQLTDKNDRQVGSTYRVLGLGLITDYDPNADVFVVESVDNMALTQVTQPILDETYRYEIQLYAQLTNRFQPFVQEESATYAVTAPKRDKAFREIVVREYEFTCAVCEMKFRLDKLIEATAAHIIPKHESGSDDPRNGLALCRTHHWAFDKGLFTVNDNYEVLLSSAVHQAETHNFTLVDSGNKQILLPDNEALRPHPEALAWHRANIWLK